MYEQTSEKYQACLNIFQSECRICSREAQMRQTNERKISSLLEYFSQRVQNIFDVYIKCMNYVPNAKVKRALCFSPSQWQFVVLFFRYPKQCAAIKICERSCSPDKICYIMGENNQK